MVLPMNTGAEAVESGIKVARKWGHDVKGIREPEHRRGRRQLPRPHHLDHLASPTTRTPAAASAPTRRASGSSRTGTLAAVAAAMRRRPRRRCWSSRSRARPAWSIPPADYLPGLRALCDRPADAAHLRRDPVGPRTHRPDLRRRARRRGAGPLPARQGARRRRRAGLGRGRQRRRARRAAPGPARLDLRRQPAGRGRRPGVVRLLADGSWQRAGRPSWAPCWATARAG